MDLSTFKQEVIAAGYTKGEYRENPGMYHEFSYKEKNIYIYHTYALKNGTIWRMSHTKE